MNQELKKYELKVLDEIDRICRKHNIKYYLAYGSALGAVRHKGFIPWDDDIDLCMLSSDLIRFKKICKQELSDNYYYQDKLTDKYYYNFWSKVGMENTTWMPKDHIVDCKYGVCVDIFPMFPVKSGKKYHKKAEKHLKTLLMSTAKYYVLRTKREKYSLHKKIIHKLIPDFIGNRLFEYSFKKLSSYENDYNQILIRFIAKDKNLYFDKDKIIGNKKLLFEGKKYPVVNDIDYYLKAFYNDYMKLPPKNKRYGHDINNSIIYDFNNSYKKYLGDKIDKS